MYSHLLRSRSSKMAKIKFAVIGNPIEHSLSPQIHTFFASQASLSPFQYTKIISNEKDFKKNVKDFFENGGRGLNVTIPFKAEAFNMCDKVDKAALLCNSVNTLSLHDDGVCGYSTDGVGFLDDIKEKSINLQNKKILILGAGGSARSIVSILIENNYECLNIFNRSQKRLKELIEKYKTFSVSEYTEGDKYDIIINTTPVSITRDEAALPKDIFNNGSISYDLFYSTTKTFFQEWSKDEGASNSYDGLGMLIHQAKHSFKIWNNFMPSTNGLENKLRRL